jgi:Tfp pilus assembly protein PilX
MDWKNNQGSTVLLLSLLMVFSMLVVTMTASVLVQNGLKMGRTQEHSTQAYFAAEAGAEQLLWEWFMQSYDPSATCIVGGCIVFDAGCNFTSCDNDCANSNKLCTLSNGTTFRIQYLQAVPTMQFQISGAYNDGMARRNIELDLN